MQKKRELFNHLKKVLNEETTLKKQQSAQHHHQQQQQQQQSPQLPPHLLTNFSSPVSMPPASPSSILLGGNVSLPGGVGASQPSSKSPFPLPHHHVSNFPLMPPATLTSLNKFFAAVSNAPPPLSPQLLMPPAAALAHQSQVMASHHSLLNYSPSSSPHLMTNSSSSPSRHSSQVTASPSMLNKRQRSPSPPPTPASPHHGQPFLYMPSRSPAHTLPAISPPPQQTLAKQQFSSPVNTSGKKVRSSASNQSPHHTISHQRDFSNQSPQSRFVLNV